MSTIVRLGHVPSLKAPDHENKICDKFSGTSPPRAHGFDDIEVLWTNVSLKFHGGAGGLLLIDAMSRNLSLYFFIYWPKARATYIITRPKQ